MIREEDRVLAGTAIVISASLSCLNQTDPALISRAKHLLNEGMKMVGSDVRARWAGPGGSGDQVSDFLMPAAEILFGKFAPIESVMGD